jgi:hypothetical protein
MKVLENLYLVLWRMKDGLIVSYIEVVLKMETLEMDFSNSLKQLLLLSGLRWSPRLQAAIATDIVERVLERFEN